MDLLIVNIYIVLHKKNVAFIFKQTVYMTYIIHVLIGHNKKYGL